MVREWSIERDERILKELYPETAKKIMPYVEAECDRMEYNGSRMYDEIPDKYMMRRICEHIFEEISSSQKKPGEIFADDDIFASEFQEREECGSYNICMKELIESLLYHEIFSRRCRHNQCKCCRTQYKAGWRTTG